MRVAALAALALAVAPTVADARVARPGLPVPMPRIVYGPCPGLPDASGCALDGVIYAATGERFVVLHELGHVFDVEMLDAGERDRFARLARMRALLWTWGEQDGDVVVQGFGTPAEHLADAYAACRMGLEPGGRRVWWTGYGYYPTRRRHRLICGMIARAGIDAGQPVSPDGDR